MPFIARRTQCRIKRQVLRSQRYTTIYYTLVFHSTKQSSEILIARSAVRATARLFSTSFIQPLFNNTARKPLGARIPILYNLQNRLGISARVFARVFRPSNPVPRQPYKWGESGGRGGSPGTRALSKLKLESTRCTRPANWRVQALCHRPYWHNMQIAQTCALYVHVRWRVCVTCERDT